MKIWVQRVALLMMIVGLLAGGQQAALASTAGARQGDMPVLSLVPATKVAVFHPKGTTGATVAGDCGMGGSLALNRIDAWRCMVGNQIYDPCFAAAAHATSVICGALPSRPYGIQVRLSAPLPSHDPVHGTRQPWILELGDGTTCGFFTGATSGVQGQRVNYGCSDQLVLVGLPQPGRVWYAVKAHISNKPSPNGPLADRIYAVSVARAWM